MDRILNVEETYLTVLVKIGPRFHTLECFLLKSILCFSPSYRMSEGDSVGESVHGKPSVVYRFFTRLGQVGGFLVDECKYLKNWTPSIFRKDLCAVVPDGEVTLPQAQTS